MNVAKCGEIIKIRAKKYIIKNYVIMCEAYMAYFGVAIEDQDKTLVPHFTCEKCTNTLEGKAEL